MTSMMKTGLSTVLAGALLSAIGVDENSYTILGAAMIVGGLIVMVGDEIVRAIKDKI